MKYSNLHIKSSMTFILIAFISLLAAGCSGSGGTDTNPPPEEQPPAISFDSGAIADGETFSHTFDTEGTIEYFCEIHAPDMQGQITVSSGADISGEHTIIMENIQFNPSSVTIAPGTTIIWENQDGVTHDIKSGNPSNNDGGPY